jgi:hypothetical protein
MLTGMLVIVVATLFAALDDAALDVAVTAAVDVVLALADVLVGVTLTASVPDIVALCADTRGDRPPVGGSGAGVFGALDVKAALVSDADVVVVVVVVDSLSASRRSGVKGNLGASDGDGPCRTRMSKLGVERGDNDGLRTGTVSDGVGVVDDVIAVVLDVDVGTVNVIGTVVDDDMLVIAIAGVVLAGDVVASAICASDSFARIDTTDQPLDDAAAALDVLDYSHSQCHRTVD